jgi:hypothetical protein
MFMRKLGSGMVVPSYHSAVENKKTAQTSHFHLFGIKRKVLG